MVSLHSRHLYFVTFWFLVNICDHEAIQVDMGVIVGTTPGDDEIRQTFMRSLKYYSGRTSNVVLKGIAERVDSDDILGYTSRMCGLIDHEVYTIFGVLNKTSEPMVDEYTSRIQMPFISVSEAFGLPNHRQKIRMLPDLAPAIGSVLTSYLNWSHAYYFYSSKEGLMGFSRMARQLQMAHLDIDLRVIKLNSTEAAIRKLDALLEQLRYSLDLPTKLKVVLDMGFKTNSEVLHSAETEPSIRWNKMAGGGMNLTILQLVDSSQENQDRLSLLLNEIVPGSKQPYSTLKALTLDAANLVRRGFIRLVEKEPHISRLQLQKNAFYSKSELNRCNLKSDNNPWDYGNVIANYLKNISFEGLSGWIEFDQYGFRKNYTLSLLNMGKKRVPEKVGVWNNKRRSIFLFETPLKIVRNDAAEEDNFNRKTIRITSHIGHPYLFYKEGAEGNSSIPNHQKFDGYIVEFIEAVMNEINMNNYIVSPVKDGGYGSEQADGSWDGMVGEVVRGEADLAIADLTINSERENVIYFSKPFLRLGISIMIKKPEQQIQSKYSFVDPLAYEVWMCVGFAYVGVSVVLFLVGRFSPYEWHIDTTGPEATMKNEFSVWNSLWFVFSTLMQQGCEVAPRAISSRIVASVWYLFTLIIISSYTANLAAFLTAARMNSPINSVEDLAKQTVIKYGTLIGGSTETFFKNSKYPTYEKMWNYMAKYPEVGTSSNDAGVQRVRDSNGRYAFLIESTNNEYISNRQPCNTMKVGANLNSQGYGVGMPLDSELKSKINIAILQLRERGRLAELEKKWWQEVGDVCQKETEDAGLTTQLTVDKIEGIFHILAAGMCAGIVIVLFELLCAAKLSAIKSQGEMSFKRSLKSHLSLFVNSNDGKESAPLMNAESKGQQKSPEELIDAKKSRMQFLSVDDVFSSPTPSRSNAAISTISGNKFLGPIDNPLVYKSEKSSASSNAPYSRKLYDANTPSPPDQFRSDGGTSNQTSL